MYNKSAPYPSEYSALMKYHFFRKITFFRGCLKQKKNTAI